MPEFLPADAIDVRLKANSKKQVLLELAKRASALTGQSERLIFDALLERERLGSTGVGRGVAIPHAKLDSLGRVFGLFAQLERPVDFDAIDDQPVDLFYLLLAPDQAGADHLKALARASRLLRDEGLCEKLRGCQTADGVNALLNERQAVRAA